MTAEELAHLLHGKRVKRGRWMAKCPAHGDRTASLCIAEGRKVPIILKCMSQGCPPAAILAAVGLSWRDLMGEAAITPAVRQRLADERKLRILEGRWLAMRLNVTQDAERRNYWEAASRRTDDEIEALKDKLDPSRVRTRKIHAALAKYGVDRVWEKFLTTDKGILANQRYSPNSSASIKRGHLASPKPAC